MYSLASCQVDGSASPYVRWRSRHPTKHGAWHNALISGLAKSYFPTGLLNSTGLRAIGSKPTRIKPQSWAKERQPEESPATELFVAGPRGYFRDFSDQLGGWHPRTRGADELPRVEDIRSPTTEERIKSCKALGFWTLIWRMVRPPWTTPAGSSGAPGLASDSCVARGAISRCRLS